MTVESSHPIGSVYIEDMHVGMRCSMSKAFSDEDLASFGGVAEDRNPLHFSDEAAAKTVFGQRVVHGMLTASLFSGLLGERLPGHGTIYLAQNLRFTAPVLPDQTVTAEVVVKGIDMKNRRVTLDCLATAGDKTVIKGSAVVIAPSRI